MMEEDLKQFAQLKGIAPSEIASSVSQQNMRTEKGSEEKQAQKTRFQDKKNKSSQRKSSRNFSPNQDSKTQKYSLRPRDQRTQQQCNSNRALANEVQFFRPKTRKTIQQQWLQQQQARCKPTRIQEQKLRNEESSFRTNPNFAEVN